MKRFVAAVLAVILSSAIAYDVCAKKRENEHQLTSLFENYENNKGVKYYNLKGLLLKLAKPSLKETPAYAVSDNLSSIEIFSMNEVSNEEKNRFTKEFLSYVSGYEKTVESKEEDEETCIFIKKVNDEILSELIVYVNGKDLAVIFMRGEIPVSAFADKQL